MSFGLNNALGEITLALFTTLAPAGAISCAALCVSLLFPGLNDICRVRISRYLWIPILVALVGLVASATHLGNPANALYVLTGVGRSPLSNEICIAIVAFGLAGSYWLASFSEKRRPLLERAWLVATICGALAFTASLAFAYNVETIVTWALPTTPLNLVLNAFMAGPLIALVVVVAAEASAVSSFSAEAAGGDFGEAPEAGKSPAAIYNLRFAQGLVVVSALSFVANVVGYLVQGYLALGLANSTLSVQQLVPHYYGCVGAFAVLAGVAVALSLHAVFRARRLSLKRALVSAVFAFLAIFIMRFVFYMMYLTVGISL